MKKNSIPKTGKVSPVTIQSSFIVATTIFYKGNYYKHSFVIAKRKQSNLL